MYERMLQGDKQPSYQEMVDYCEAAGPYFHQLNEWLSATNHTASSIVFPYGKHYGWSVSHRIKKKLFCHVFAEKQGCTVMLRLSHAACQALSHQVSPYAQHLLDHLYPCGDSGWLHYRVTTAEQCQEIKPILSQKKSLHLAE